MQQETEAWRGAMSAVLQRGVQSGSATKASAEENPPGTPPTTGEEAMENETAETEVRTGGFS